MIGVCPANLDAAAKHNAPLPEEVRRMASGQYLSAIAYELALQPDDSFPHTLCVLNEEGGFKSYHAHSLNLTPELYGYCLLPDDKESGDVKVIFRGTALVEGSLEAILNSLLINLEHWGPGVKSFNADSEKLFIRLRELLQNHYGEAPPDLSLQVSGHSQGGALSQLFINAFLEERLKHKDFDVVKAVTMTVLNSPGVPYEVGHACTNNLIRQSMANKPIKMIANYGMVGGDTIQTTGLDMIFAHMPSVWAEVNLMKVDRGLEGHWIKDLNISDGLQAEEIIQVIVNATEGMLGAHKNIHFFAPLDSHGHICMDAKYDFYTNRRPEDRQPMRSELLNKAVILSHLFYYTQSLVNGTRILPTVEKYTGSLSRNFIKILDLIKKTPDPSLETEAFSRLSLS